MRLTLAAASSNILTNLELVEQALSDERMRMRSGGNTSKGKEWTMDKVPSRS
jgi:hypothetical protein